MPLSIRRPPLWAVRQSQLAESEHVSLWSGLWGTLSSDTRSQEGHHPRVSWGPEPGCHQPPLSQEPPGAQGHLSWRRPLLLNEHHTSCSWNHKRPHPKRRLECFLSLGLDCPCAGGDLGSSPPAKEQVRVSQDAACLGCVLGQSPGDRCSMLPGPPARAPCHMLLTVMEYSFGCPGREGGHDVTRGQDVTVMSHGVSRDGMMSHRGKGSQEGGR